MVWDKLLEDGETLCWQGRPAPRCYTFRNWKHSLFGLLLTLLTSWWQAVGLQMAADYDRFWIGLIPLPFWLFSLYLAVGHLIVARLEWDRISYALTDRRLLVRSGLIRSQIKHLLLENLQSYRLRSLGEALGSVRVQGGDGELLLCCIEQPKRLTDLLDFELHRNGRSVENGAAGDQGLRQDGD